MKLQLHNVTISRGKSRFAVEIPILKAELR